METALAGYNAERRIRVGRIRRSERVLWCAVALFCGFGLLAFSGLDAPQAAAAIVALGVFALIAGRTATEAMWRRLGSDGILALMPLLVPDIDDWAIGTRQPAPDIARMPGHYFVAREEMNSDWFLKGRRKGRTFSLTQAELRNGDADSPQVTFKGLILQTTLDTAFPGDFAALRRPQYARSLWRGTSLPDRLHMLAEETRLGRWAYDFVSTDPEVANGRLGRMVTALDALMAIKCNDLPQIALRGRDAFVLLPFMQPVLSLGEPGADIEVDRHLRPFVARLTEILSALDQIQSI